MMMAPEYKPAAPTPAMARPAMKAPELGAVAHTKLPSSKMATATRYTTLVEKMVNSLPNSSWKALEVKR